MKSIVCFFFLAFSLSALPAGLWAQENMIVNMAQVDGIDLSPDNIFNFQIMWGRSMSTPALIKGTIKFKGSDMNISYEFKYTLQPGLNLISANTVSPQFRFSSIALKELFEQYKRLPEGIYEYCVSVQPDSRTGETAVSVFSECVYHKAQDVFLINLLDPEDNARIYEYNPMLSWTANFPFLSALSYKISIAAMKKGQNAVTAITRNNPIYEEKNLMQMNLVYPVFAKPLEKDQYYAWTVKAYYKGLLLGGAETWKFKIVEDSMLVAISKDPSYVDIKRESGRYSLYAPGILKLKYQLDDLRTDSLSLVLYDSKQKVVKLKTTTLQAVNGDNRFIIDFKEEQPLKHMKSYLLLIRSQGGQEYKVLFKYVNPELIK